MIISWTFILLSLLLVSHASGDDIAEKQMETLLTDYNSKSIEKCRESVLASWNVATDVGNVDKEKQKVSNMMMSCLIIRKQQQNFSIYLSFSLCYNEMHCKKNTNKLVADK